MPDKINNVSSQAVRKATGRGWAEWIRFIDENGGAGLDHRQIVALLAGPGGVGQGWWQQMLTVGYEHARGRRQTGETADAGFQVGVQRVIPLGRTALWRLLLSEAGVQIWIGPVGALSPEPGTRFELEGGPGSELLSVKVGQRLRLRYDPAGGTQATTLQLSLSCPRNTAHRTTLRFHHEKLASAEQREQMRSHWKAVLAELVALATA